MITDIPTSRDFYSVGTSLLNSAWDTAASLLLDVDEAKYFDVDTDEVSDAYWSAARIELSTALSIAQQGSEFLLKGRIASVSPFLLLGAQPKDWPKGCTSNDTPFSEFRTIDAQDLIKVHNTCHTNKLSPNFIESFEDLRKKRNSIMHSIDKRLSVHAVELITSVLDINHALGEESNWAKVRHEHLKNAPLSQMHTDEWADVRQVREFAIVLDLLQPSTLLEYFGFNKKQRSYICPHCAYSLARDSEIYPKSATLKPNTPKSQSIYCFICGTTQDVERTPCTEGTCKGNVISPDYGRCLTCGEYAD